MHTDAELQEMAEQVLYELHAFRGAIEATAVLKKTDERWNRALESALLHFRILRGFFIDEPKNDDDVSAKDYVSAWNPKADEIFNETKIPLDKRLAHLTWRRLPWSPGRWDLVAMKAAIGKLVELFKGSLAADRSAWFYPSAVTVTRGMLDEDGNSTVSGSCLA